MNNIKYTCECCGKEHESWPALTYNAPFHYHCLSESDKDEIAVIDSDFCVIKHKSGQIDRFIRVVLIQKVNDHCGNLDYGLWVSLSEESFENYLENFDNENHETEYFGWLCNNIYGYDSSTSIPTTVVTKLGNDRPEIFPHQSHDHKFVVDYFNGITKSEAENRIQNLLNGI